MVRDYRCLDFLFLECDSLDLNFLVMLACHHDIMSDVLLSHSSSRK